jgi:hypothetical protein
MSAYPHKIVKTMIKFMNINKEEVLCEVTNNNI